MRMCSIASGSSGNCIYVGSDNSHLLIDTGISKKRIEEGLNKLEIKGDELDGIHDHNMNIRIILRDLVCSAESTRYQFMRTPGNDCRNQRVFQSWKDAGRTFTSD